MRVVIRRQKLRWMLPWTWGTLFFGGLSLLVYCAFVLVEARGFQEQESRLLDRLLIEKRPLSLQMSAPDSALSAKVPVAVGRGGLIGRMKIPRLGLSAMIIEGSDPATLRRAVGHIPGTPLPRIPGNTAITAHRDTFFRPLRHVRQDDVITLTTLEGMYLYRVVSTSVVNSDDVSVLRSHGSESLTLITCYPFYYVGAAPQRFIVRAQRVREQTLPDETRPSQR